MIEFKKIELEDKDIINKYFFKTKFNNAEKNFSNLFMWRHTYEYEYIELDGCLCIRGKTRDTKETFYHFPYGNCKEQLIERILEKIALSEKLNENNEDDKLNKENKNENKYNKLLIKPVLPEMKECLEKQVNTEKFEIVEDRNSFDYIYTTTKLIELKGKKFRTKRRWVKKFIENYNYTYENITKENLKEAKEFTLNIIKDSNNDKDELMAMTEMFDNLFALNITGCIIRVDGEIVGVSAGEAITDDTILIHCERANRDYEGIYNFINQEFIKREWSDYKYVNREEDLGIEGLRYAKMKYQPDNLLTKYIAVLKEDKCLSFD